jgi:hypothetical protein
MWMPAEIIRPWHARRDAPGNSESLKASCLKNILCYRWIAITTAMIKPSFNQYLGMIPSGIEPEFPA